MPPSTGEEPRARWKFNMVESMMHRELKLYLLFVDNPLHPLVTAERHSAQDGNGDAETALAKLAILDLLRRHDDGVDVGSWMGCSSMV
jgi:hypothetical protein